MAEGEKFSISIFPARRLVKVVLRGFWDEGTVAAYDASLWRTGAAMAAAGCPREQILALVDAREAGPQAQEVIAGYRERFGAPERQPRRIATVVTSALLRRQVERVAMPNHRVFSDEDAALVWLAEED